MMRNTISFYVVIVVATAAAAAYDDDDDNDATNVGLWAVVIIEVINCTGLQPSITIDSTLHADIRYVQM